MKNNIRMRKSGLVAVLACVALVSRADTIVGAGTTLAITNAEDYGLSPIQMSAGSTLTFLGASSGSAGLNEYTRTNVSALGVQGISPYGTWTRVTTNVAYAAETSTASNTEYIYTGRWHIPAAGIYSFYENIDDAVGLYVDSVLLLNNGVWNVETRKQDVVLAEGWHDLEIRFRNGAGTGGQFLPYLKSGLLYSPVNDVITTNNQANAYPFVDTGDRSVLQTVHNGVLLQKTLVSGNVTFDLTGQGLVSPLSVVGGLMTLSNSASAKVSVAGGAGELVVVGTTGQLVNFTPFGVDVAFSGVTDPKGVTFRDQCTVIACPTSCVWRVADNATIALFGTNILGIGDITLTNHNIFVLSSVAVTENATVHVQGTNLTVSVKPCTLDAVGNWSGSITTLTNDIALEGIGSAAVFPDNVDFYLQGKISGTGTVSKTGSMRTQIKEACDFVGDVSCAGGNTMVFESATAGHSNNTVTVGANTTLALYPPGYGSTDTTAWIKTLHGVGTTNKLYLPAKQTMTVDYLDGSLAIEGSGATLHINMLGTNATLSVVGNTAVEVGTFAPGAALTLAGPGTPLRATSAGATLDSLTLAAGSIPVSGAFTISQLSGAGSLVKKGAETLQICFNTTTNGIRIDAGKVLFSKPSTNSFLGTLPALWLDASASNVFTQYKTYTVTNNFKVIERWNDCRTGAAGYAYNDRGEDNYQVYPYVMTAAQNGLSVLSLGAYQGTISTIFGSRTESRRIYLYTNIAPQYVVMTFGSQNGGGISVLGGTTLLRAGSTTNDFRNPATPILASPSYPVWTNGVSVVATNTGLSGGYQILSVNARGTSINALGWKIDNTTAGGQNYGEVLIYTNALTSIQRMTAEAYLAEKWGLPCMGTTIPAVTVAAGATVEINGNYAVGSVSGAGSIINTGTSTFSLNGIFSGSVDMVGGTLSIPDVPAIPNDSIVPTGNLAAWFDPGQTNRVILGGAYTPTRPQTIAALFDRTTTNRYLQGTCPLDLSYDRRPWLSVTNGPLGGTQYWIDYANLYGDLNGNTLRLNRNPANIGTAVFTGVTPTNVQSGFIVLDSSRGGGVPITYAVSADSVVTRNNPQLTSSPIWGSATTASLKSGATYLDGVSVNGAANGFSGTTELLSFVATNIFQAAYFGYYGGDGSPGGTLNRERLGEIILFDAALDNGTRANIEAYLMKKWLGKARAGYGEVTSAIVSGSGTVQAAKPSQLPTLAVGFTGTVALSGTLFGYTLTTNATGTCVVAPATVVPGSLTVAPAGTITVDFAVKPPAGTYAVMTYSSITGGGLAGWTLVTTGKKPAGTVSLKATATALNLSVISQGTMIVVY
jgi:hypothetical protein